MRILRQPYWRLLFLLPLVIAFSAYFQTTEYAFVWDDRHLLLRSPDLRDWSLIWSAIGQAFLNYQGYFRPLPLLSLALEQLLFPPGSFIPHLNAALLFSVNCVLLGLLGAVLAEQRALNQRSALIIGLGGACMYALHPALIESVAWVSCRFDLFVSFFGLSMLLADRLIGAPLRRAVVVGILFFLAAMSKEMALGLALALPLMQYWLSPPVSGWRPAAEYFRANNCHYSWLGVVIAGLLYLALRFGSQATLYVAAVPAYEPWTLQHALVVFKSIGAYAQLAVWPFTGLGPLYPLYLPLSPFDKGVMAGVIFVIANILLLVLAARGFRGGALVLLAFTAALLPVINLIPLQIGDNYAHERFLNLPLVFFCLSVTFLLHAVVSAPHAKLVSSRLRAALVGFLTVYWLAFSVLNIKANLPFWKDNLSLWTLANMRDPRSRMVQTNLQSAYVNAGLYQEAIEFTEKLLQRNGGRLHFEHVENYMLALSALGQSTRGLIPPMLERLRSADSEVKLAEFHAIYANLGWLWMFEGNIEEAVPLFMNSLKLKPTHPRASLGLVVAHTVLDQPERAREFYLQWLKYEHPASITHWKSQLPNVVRRVRAARESIEGRAEVGGGRANQ